MDPWLTLLAGSNNFVLLLCTITLSPGHSSYPSGIHELLPARRSTSIVRDLDHVRPSSGKGHSTLRARSGIDYTFRQDQLISSTLHARFVTIGRIQAPVLPYHHTSHHRRRPTADTTPLFGTVAREEKSDPPQLYTLPNRWSTRLTLASGRSIVYTRYNLIST